MNWINLNHRNRIIRKTFSFLLKTGFSLPVFIAFGWDCEMFFWIHFPDQNNLWQLKMSNYFMINLLWTESWKPTKIKKIDILHAEITRHLVKSVSKLWNVCLWKRIITALSAWKPYHLKKSYVLQDDKQYLWQSHV